MRTDIPAALLARATQIDPSLAAWLEAAYPTEQEHARNQRRRRAQEAQLALPLRKVDSTPEALEIIKEPNA